MAGAYRLLMSRAKVTVTNPALPGDDVVHTAATVSVRDGVALMTVRGAEPVSLAGATVQRHSARRATVVGGDGTVWQVERGCGCGGNR